MAQCNGWLPLHLACANQATGDVVRLLLLVCPEAATVGDEKGYLPLHIACNYGASIEVIEILLDTYADGTLVQGKDGALPLHLACLRQMPLPVVELLVETYPEGMKVKNNDGYTPLEVSNIRDERRKVLVTAKQLEKPLPNDSIPFERRICSHVLRNALMSKCPLEAVQLSPVFAFCCKGTAPSACHISAKVLSKTRAR
jgi:ankyrin repeat protein